MTKLNGEKSVSREIETTYQDKPVILTITGQGVLYRLKGHKNPLAVADHATVIAGNHGGNK